MHEGDSDLENVPAGDPPEFHGDPLWELLPRCDACNQINCHISKPTCPYHAHKKREDHADAAHGDNVPHFAQMAITRASNTIYLDGKKHIIGTAPGTGCNCLIYSLAEVLHVSTVDAPAIRKLLQQHFQHGEQRVTSINYLTAEYHWASIVRSLGFDEKDVRLICVSLTHSLHGSTHVVGPPNSNRHQIAIANEGNSHFVPLIPAT